MPLTVHDVKGRIKYTPGPNAFWLPVRTVSGNTTLSVSDYVVLVNATATVTLPAGTTGQPFIIKSIGVGIVVTINTTSSQTIDGVLTLTITDQYVSVSVVFDGANWNII